MNLLRLWTGMLTRGSNDSGTDSRIALIINQGGATVLDHTFSDTAQADQETSQANLYELNVAENNIIPENLSDSSILVGIRGSDAWRPQHFFVWGERLAPGQFGLREVVPLAIETDISTTLSTDDDEGSLTLALRRVAKGSSSMQINRLFMLLTTGGEPDDDLIAEGVIPRDTDSPIEIQIVSEGRLVVLSEIRDTPQDDLELGAANFYSAPVIAPFTRRSLDDNSITLRLKGLDNWEPASLFIFGLDDAAGRPESIVPLVHLPRWPHGMLEADPTTGAASVTLELVREPPSIFDPGAVIALREGFESFRMDVNRRLDRIATRQEQIVKLLRKVTSV